MIVSKDCKTKLRFDCRRCRCLCDDYKDSSIEGIKQQKCRIPQRYPKLCPKPKTPLIEKNRTDIVIPIQNRNITPQRSTERQKSAFGRLQEISQPIIQIHPQTKFARHERASSGPKAHRFLGPLIKKNPYEKNKSSTIVSSNRVMKEITVPVVIKQDNNKSDDFVSRQEDFSDASKTFEENLTDFNESDCVITRSDNILELQMNWKNKICKFENMKRDLSDRQNNVMDLYASIRSTQEQLTKLGQKASLSMFDDLRIIDISKMNPNQLLRFYAETTSANVDDKQLARKILKMDVTKLQDMPSKLIATCEETLAKRKEFIDWFNNLKNHEKECPKSKLTKKINEFNAENEMLNSTLQTVKMEFLENLNEITEFVKNCMDQTITFSLINNNLTSEISNLNSKNSELRAQIYDIEHNKRRIEELEHEINEEKIKIMTLNDTLTRAEGQIKIGEDRAAQLEIALDKSRAQTRPLERTIQELNEQYRRLQEEFDKELTKLKDSVCENTKQFKILQHAKELLQSEKTELEKRLENLSNEYDESINSMKFEIELNASKRMESEKLSNEKLMEIRNLQLTIEMQDAKLVETELRNQETLNQLQEIELELQAAVMDKTEMENIKRELEKVKDELTIKEDQGFEQNKLIFEIKNNLEQSRKYVDQLRNELERERKYVEDLENKQTICEQRIKESDLKMQSYEDQLSNIKQHIKKLQDYFGSFENFNELYELINVKNKKALELTIQNDELIAALRTKTNEIELYLKTIAEQEQAIKQKSDVNQALTEKEEEQSNIIKLLRNNLEIRAQADSNINEQLNEKYAEIKSLLANLEARKRQICQLEKIILALDEQSRKSILQRKRDLEKMSIMEKQIAEFEQCLEKKNNDKPFVNLNHLFKKIEAEMRSSVEPFHNKNETYKCFNNNYNGDYKDICHGQDSTKAPCLLKEKKDDLSSKIALGNFIKKTQMTNKEPSNDLPIRKQALTNIKANNTWFPSQGDIYEDNHIATSGQNIFLTTINPEKLSNVQRNLPSFADKKAFYDKKCKMFQIASHKL